MKPHVPSPGGGLRVGDLAARRRPGPRPADGGGAVDYPTVARWLSLPPAELAAKLGELRRLPAPSAGPGNRPAPPRGLRGGLATAADALADLARTATADR
ncbi:MAG: hypothetical protein AAGN66_01090 [Acidobacteriota bacterium]